MLYRMWVQVIVVLVLIAAFFGLAMVHTHMLFKFSYAVIILLCIGYGFKLEQYRQHLLRDERDKALLQVMDHQRHDWMNDIQVIFGYVQLKKYDNLLPFMESIKDKACKEGLISKLGLSDLAIYLHMYQIQAPSIQLDIEISQDLQLNRLVVSKFKLSKLLQEILSIFRKIPAQDDGDLNVLGLQWYEEEDYMFICFGFRGIYDQPQLKRLMAKALTIHSSFKRIELRMELEKEWADIELKIPLKE